MNKKTFYTFKVCQYVLLKIAMYIFGLLKEESSFNSTFGVDFNADFMTAVDNIEQRHISNPDVTQSSTKPDKPGSNKSLKISKQSPANKENKKQPNQRGFPEDKNCSKNGKSLTTPQPSRKAAQCTPSRKDQNTPAVTSSRQSQRRAAKEAPVTRQEGNNGGGIASSLDLSNISLCSPLHISTPTNTYMQRNAHKSRTLSSSKRPMTTPNSITKQRQSARRLDKARLFGNISITPESGKTTAAMNTAKGCPSNMEMKEHMNASIAEETEPTSPHDDTESQGSVQKLFNSTQYYALF